MSAKDSFDLSDDELDYLQDLDEPVCASTPSISQKKSTPASAFSTISVLKKRSNESSTPDNDNDNEDQPQPMKKQKKILNPEKLKSFQEKHDRSGVVYLSRIPPGMKPAQLKHLLSRFGSIGRVYLAPEDEQKRKQRLKSTNTSRRKRFTEGWIEFLDKKIAKTTASILNNTPMGSKTSYYSTDLWTIKYLPRFKWVHLAAQMQYERQERVKREQVEVGQSRREVEMYLKQVDRKKMVKAISERRQLRGETGTGGEMGVLNEGAGKIVDDKVEQQQQQQSVKPLNSIEVKRRFKQRRPVDDTEGGRHSEKVQKVLNNIFS